MYSLFRNIEGVFVTYFKILQDIPKISCSTANRYRFKACLAENKVDVF